MHEGTLRTLEFDRIVEAVRSFASTPLGASALHGLTPRTDAQIVKAELQATTEMVAYLEANPPFALDGPADLEEIVAALAIEGRPLLPGQLLGAATFLASVGAVRGAHAAASGGPYPLLRAVVDRVQAFDEEVGTIRARIDPQGDVVDDATPQLRAIRDRLRRQRQRLRATLESYLRGRETVKYLQERVVTERDGRFVLVIRSEHRTAIPGIVHGSSGSGASLFLEPLSTVEINNEIVAFEEEERLEVHRILLDLSNALRKRALDLRRTLAAAGELDVLQARASFSRLVGGVEPALSPDGRLELPDARHPLLIPAVRERAGETAAARGGDESGNEPDGPVPVHISIAPPIGALIVTGPNTGGKTVALKTVGLLALMAQAGLHVPAGQGATAPVFQSIFADIGDEQSIADSLSTFSGHMANIVAMDERLKLPALVLLDEVGAGTDPVEGGALGAAVIEHFRRREALVVATTHDDTLKSYASTTDGVACAGFGFDPDTYAPTYRLAYGAPGRSLALEIAARLGVPPSIIDDARARRGVREAQLADHLARVEQDRERVDAERGELAASRSRLDEERAGVEEVRRALAEREKALRERSRSGVDAEIRSARQAVEEIVGSLRTRAAELTSRSSHSGPGPPQLTTGETGGLKREALDAIEKVRKRSGPAAVTAEDPDPGQERPAATAGPPPVGSRVRVESLRLEGIVAATHGRDAEVEARGKRIHVPFSDLRVLEPDRAQPAGAGGGVTVAIASEQGPPVELNVIGCRVDDALSRVEKYVDQAMLHERRELRVIHGHGTGQLRRAIAGFLGEHPLVARFAPAPPEHGGGGVTVIALKD